MPALDREETLRELGRAARERRENAQISLESIYDRTRIRIEYLMGIEQGNYRDFPDIVYTKGFVRTYLGMIGAGDMNDDFSEWLSKDNAPKSRNLPPTNILGNSTPPTKGFKPASHFWMFLLLILTMLGAGGYVWYNWDRSRINPFIVDNNLSAGKNTSGANGASDNTTSAATASDDISFDVMPNSHDQNLLAIIPTTPVVAAPTEPEPAYLQIRARDDVWMSVKIGDKVVYSQTMRAGGGASWDLTGRAEVRYGRPNMAEVVLNGKELGVPNPRGARTSETYFYEPDGESGKVQ